MMRCYVLVTVALFTAACGQVPPPLDHSKPLPQDPLGTRPHVLACPKSTVVTDVKESLLQTDSGFWGLEKIGSVTSLVQKRVNVNYTSQDSRACVYTIVVDSNGRQNISYL